MTKKNFTLLFAFFICLSAFGQQVEEKQRLVVTKRTATWCPNCGNWGWTLMENLIADNEGKAILINAHEEGSSLGIEASEAITANWGSFAQPSFFVNEVNQSAFSSNIGDKRTEIKEQVDAAFDSQPIANVGFDPVFVNGEIKVDAKVKFFQNATGNFYLGIYLLEDNVMASQAGSVSDDNHMRVMQYSFTDGSWGNQFAEGNILADQEYDLSFALPIGGVDGYDYHVVGIIYNLDGGVYKPINAWSTTTISEVSSVDEIGGLIDFQVNPNLISTQANIQLNLDNSLENTSIDLIDMTGKSVRNLFTGNLSAGQNTINFTRENEAQGVYFVRMTNGQQVSTKRIVLN